MTLNWVANTPEEQSDLDRLEEWAIDNKMNFNWKKCKVSHLGKNVKHKYKMGNTWLLYVKRTWFWWIIS